MSEMIAAIKRLERGQRRILTPDSPKWTYAQRCGFVDLTETTIAFDDGTYTFTLTDAGNGWTYMRDGASWTIDGNKTTVLAGTPPATGIYYIVIDATDGTLSNSTVPWTLEDDQIPVAIVIWNNGLTPKYWLMDERHTCLIDRRDHWYLHHCVGTRLYQLGAIADYVVPPAAPASNDDNTWSLAETIIADEDLKHTLTALADGDGVNANYTVFYRTAAAAWSWVRSIVPYQYTAAGYIQYDNAGAMTQGQASKYYNWYVLATNLSGDGRFVCVPGRSEFSSLSAAQNEDWAGFSWSGFPIAESVMLYRLTFTTSNAYGTDGKCKVAATAQRISTSLNTVATATPIVAAPQVTFGYYTSTDWDGDAKAFDSSGIIDLSADFGLPANIKAVVARITAQDETVGVQFSLHDDSDREGGITQFTQVANQAISIAGIVPCDANGDIYFYQSGELDNVYIRISGYFA